MIYALDLSLTATGWAVCQGDGPVEFGTLKWSAFIGDARNHYIAGEIFYRIPDDARPLIVMEDFSFGSQGRAIYDIGMLAGVIRYGLFRRGIPYVLVAPTTLKKFVTGKGNAQKNMMILDVFRRFGIETENDNAADAIGLLHIGKALLGRWEPTIEQQREVVSDLRKKNAWLEDFVLRFQDVEPTKEEKF